MDTQDKNENEIVLDAEAEELDTSKLTNDPEVAEDLKNLSKSKLTLESFEEYMRLRNEMEKIPKNELRHKAKVLKKRKAAARAAKFARKKNRSSKKH